MMVCAFSLNKNSLNSIHTDDVVRVTRSEAITRRDEDEEEEEGEEKHKTEGDAIKLEDVEMAETSKPKTTRKKKEKKVIPMGKNGLKKRKVMKTRKEIKDGYMGRPCLINDRHDIDNNAVTEDYSDWESVDEEDMEGTLDPPKTKGKGVAKASKIAKKEPEEEEEKLAATAGLSEESQQETAAPTKSTVKPPAKPSKRTSASSKGGQKSLANFFGPPKAKKI
jgi:DNA polymerase delta subunit 3